MSKFRCPECFRPNYVPCDTDKDQIDCSFCSKNIKVPHPSYPPGTDIKGFVIEEWLGNGSLGEIYRAKQTSIDNRLVALKIVTKDHIHCEQDMERFVREIQTVAQLNHRNIATAFLAAKFDDGAYLASHFVDGQTLDDVLKDGPITEERVLNFSHGIASALKYAWDKFKVLHRDLKPTNFMVDDKDRIFLVDLCVAKSLEIFNDITMQGQVIGTPYYISPEQARAEEDIDFKTDIYGLGATMYQMLTGNPPFFNEGNHLEVTAKKLKELPKTPKELNPDVSDEVSDFIMKLLAIDKNDRPADWDAVIELIEDLQAEDDEEESVSEADEEVKAEDKPVEEEKKETPAESKAPEETETGGDTMKYILAAVAVIIIIILATTLGK